MKRDSDEKELYVPVDHFMVAGKNLYEIVEEFMSYRFITLFRCMNIQIFEISSVETSIPGYQPVSLNLSVSSY